jgi:transglutaminase-like putative cysteine protease
MRYRVRHLTTYHYGEPVLLSHHAAHLAPRLCPGQSHADVRLEISPAPAVRDDGKRDYFGNPMTFFTIQDAHTRLTVDASFVVETSPPPALPHLDRTPWEHAAAELADGGAPRIEAALDFLFPSYQVPQLPEARAYAEPSFPPGRPLVDAVLDLNHRIHADLAFDPDATTVGTPLAQVFAQRRGVCQDFAHMTIACLRAMGLAARYVSGYIRTLPPPGKERLVGADASHAWAAVFLPGQGWLDIDPTNDTLAGEDHIVVAWGRDYDDVSPLRGVVLGGGHHQITVGVDVEEIT